MPKRLIDHVSDRIAWTLVWSNDWHRFRPWENQGEPLPYFGRTVEVESGVKITTYILGPLALLIGTNP